MGNNVSRIKSKILKAPRLPEYVQKESKEERILNRYMSNDVSADDRLQMYHFVKRYIYDSNFSAPIEEKLIQGGYKVLDIACGSGAWLLDLSTRYDNSHFFGIDFQEVYPQEIKPPNLKFTKADILEGLPFPDNEFDFVRQDSMSHVLQRNQWEFVLSEIVRVTKPGGYIELAELNITFNGFGPILHRIYGGMRNFLLKQNVDINVTYELESMLKSQPNVTTIHRDERELIIGPNGGKIGIVCHESFVMLCNTELAIENLSSEIGVSKEEFKNMIGTGLKEDLKVSRPELMSFRLWTQKKD
ncbi:7073_t:CDS:2 [Funneliformis mosseae]|uniref:7073_t:CDS:1 n=1 Tax=Funneliformis mosseae TaxID=27381 RepID=A0A9N9FBI9_FUNMO|nr:7073_t:CDS:2 [Funneliformis mosseae]